MPKNDEPGLIVANYIPIYRKPQLERHAKQMRGEELELEMPECCPDCRSKNFEVQGRASGTFLCLDCRCYWCAFGNERWKMPKSIEPEKCPECGHTEWHVYYSSPGSFRCKKCQCHWQEEDSIPINGKAQAKLKILSHGNTKKEYWDEVERVTPKKRCTGCQSSEYFAITNSHDRKVKFVCKSCNTVWTEGE